MFYVLSMQASVKWNNRYVKHVRDVGRLNQEFYYSEQSHTFNKKIFCITLSLEPNTCGFDQYLINIMSVNNAHNINKLAKQGHHVNCGK